MKKLEKDKIPIFPKDKARIEVIWDLFGGYSASRLVDITHAHTPWSKAYKSPKKEISQKSISEYYTPLFNK